MKKLLLLLSCVAGIASAQAIRFETTAQTTNAQCSPGSLCPLLAVPGATVQVYSTYPTVPATTYTDVTGNTQCPAFAQVTLPGSFSCTSASDNAGNVGFWISQGTFYYTLTFPVSAGGGIKGPFAFTAGASGAVAPGADKQVIYNNHGSFGADINFQWDSTIPLLTVNGQGLFVRPINTTILSPQSAMTLGLSGSGVANVGAGPAFVFQSVNSAGALSYLGRVSSTWINPTAGSESSAVTFTVRQNAADTFALSTEMQMSYGTATFTGIADTPGIILTNGGFVFSTGGFFSQANSWQGINSLTDGALLRGYGLAANAANTAGGYLDLAPISYNPNGGGACTDANGNPVQQPLPLNGLGGFGTHDAVLWVGTSPQMPPGGSCGAILPVDLIYGLNTNSYFFARGGLATDQPFYNAINTIYLSGGNPSGGVEANTHISGTLYPTGTVTTTGTLGTDTYLGGHMVMGHSIGPPAAGTIATVTNPLSSGEGLIQGMFYFDDNTGHPSYYNGSTWIDWTGGGGGGGCTPGGVHFSIQINNGAGGCTGDASFTYTSATSVSLGNASFLTVGTSAGFNATTCTAANCIQAPLGGVLGLTLRTTDSVIWVAEGAPTLSVSGQARMYFDSGSFTLQCSLNGGAYGNCAGGSGSGAPGAPTNSIQVNNGSGGFAGNAGLTYATGVVTLTTGSFQTTGASNGFNASACTTANCIQAPLGGILGLTLRTTDSVIWVAEAVPAVSAAGQARMYLDSGTFTLQCSYNASAYTNCSAAGGSGTVSAATPGQLAVYSGTTVVGGSPVLTLSGGNVLTVTGPGIATNGAFNSTATGSSTAIVVNGGVFTVNASGAVSAAGVIVSNGGGLNVTAQLSASSIQTMGGVNACNTGSCTSGSAFSVGGVPIVTSALAATFSTVVANGAINSTVTGFGTAFVSGGGTFIVNGNGAISGAGVISSTGGSGGVNVTSQLAANSIQTAGGFNACSSGVCSGGTAYEINGTQVISSGRQASFFSVVATNVFNSQATASTIAFQTSSGTVQIDGYGDGSFGGSVNALGNPTLSLAPYRVNGTAIVDASRNLLNIGNINATGTMTLGSAATFNGGILLNSATNSVVYIGSGGSFYDHVIAGSSTGVSCSGIQDGYMAITTDDFVVVCRGNSRFRAALAAY